MEYIMKKSTIQMFCSLLALFCIGSFCNAQASEGYTKTISMDGDKVEYNYIEDEKDEEEDKESTPVQKSIYYFSTTPYTNYWPAYQTGYWGHYPSTGYKHHYGKGPIVYTYSSTGIKTGPDGRVITPLMEREMYNYRHNPPPPPPPRMHNHHRPPMHHPPHFHR